MPNGHLLCTPKPKNNAHVSLDGANALLRDSGLSLHFTEGLQGSARERQTGFWIRDAIGRAPSDVGARRFVQRLMDGQAQSQAPRACAGKKRAAARTD